jgi:acetyl-CoA carboxylase biotin carboxyl carrier protein
MASLDSELLRHALDVARKHGFAEVELELDGARFSAHLEPAPRRRRGDPPTDAGIVQEPALKPLRSTLVGYFRAGRKPLQPGDQVDRGDVVGVVAALGIANDIESKETGEVVEVLVKDGDPVEFGQPIALVRVVA